MAKQQTKSSNAALYTASPSSSQPRLATELRNDLQIGYKLRVLLYDLRNMAKDHISEARTLATTDPTYINGPYFTLEEADLVRNALVTIAERETDDGRDDDEDAGPAFPGQNNLINSTSKVNVEVTTLSKSETTQTGQITVEQAIQSRLANFFEKRKASGDARPCGPHEMAPIYQS